jgi:hypothetical protein
MSATKALEIREVALVHPPAGARAVDSRGGQPHEPLAEPPQLRTLLGVTPLQRYLLCLEAMPTGLVRRQVVVVVQAPAAGTYTRPLFTLKLNLFVG